MRDDDGFYKLVPKEGGLFSEFIKRNSRKFFVNLNKKINKATDYGRKNQDNHEDYTKIRGEHRKDKRDSRPGLEFNPDWHTPLTRLTNADKPHKYDNKKNNVKILADAKEMAMNTQYAVECKYHGYASKSDDIIEKITDPEYIKNAIWKASKGKRKRNDVSKIIAHREDYVPEVQDLILLNKWTPPKHKTTTINEGGDKKEREITKPHFKWEQVVHHLVVPPIKTIVETHIGKHMMGSIPGRGPYLAAKRLYRWIKLRKGKKTYVAELDIRKFYDTIDHKILKWILRRYFSDGEYLDLLHRIIDTYTSEFSTDPIHPRGLPLGNYTSPWFSNLYVLDMDNFIEHVLKPKFGIKHYVRYADNIFLIGKNKKDMHRAVIYLREWLEYNLRLEIKDNWQVYRFEHVEEKTKKNGRKKTVVHGRPIDALGFVIHHNGVKVRKRIIKPARKLARKIGKIIAAGKEPSPDLYASLVSRLGFLWKFYGRKYYHKYIKPYITAQMARSAVSKHSKREAKKAAKVLNRVMREIRGNLTDDEMIEKGLASIEVDDKGKEHFEIDISLVTEAMTRIYNETKNKKRRRNLHKLINNRRAKRASKKAEEASSNTNNRIASPAIKP